MFVDLHSHSTASDGTDRPAEVVRLAKASGLNAIALTDHDTIDGLAEASETARQIGIDFLHGIEISAQFPLPGTLHILGYGIDPSSTVLGNAITSLLAQRDDRNPKIVAKLNELGVAISMNEVQDEAHGGVIGRPHIAAILVRKGYVSSIKHAFDKYLAQGAPAYFDKERLSPRTTLQLIRDAGGLPVLAHPVQLRCSNDAQLELTIKNLLDQGLAGIETIHSDHNAALVEKYSSLATKFSLLQTGGSDYHGSKKAGIDLGNANGRKIPRELYDRLIDALRKSS